MKLITLHIPEPWINEIDDLVRLKDYSSRSEVIRMAIRDLLSNESTLRIETVVSRLKKRYDFSSPSGRRACIREIFGALKKELGYLTILDDGRVQLVIDKQISFRATKREPQRVDIDFGDVLYDSANEGCLAYPQTFEKFLLRKLRPLIEDERKCQESHDFFWRKGGAVAVKRSLRNRLDDIEEANIEFEEKVRAIIRKMDREGFFNHDHEEGEQVPYREEE